VSDSAPCRSSSSSSRAPALDAPDCPSDDGFSSKAESTGKFGLEVADLKEIGLPLLDEPKHPRFGDYQHDHTKAWSAMIRGAEHSPSLHRVQLRRPLLRCLNAIDYLFHEWSYKPAGFVSYGGHRCGYTLGSDDETDLDRREDHADPRSRSDSILFATHGSGWHVPRLESLEKSATTMLDELHRWGRRFRASAHRPDGSRGHAADGQGGGNT